MTARHQPHPTAVQDWLDGCPGQLRDMVAAIRDMVRGVVPDAVEDIKFGSLCYYRPDQPFGCIGGNVCMISCKDDAVVLSFIHGAFLPDPQRLLKGQARSKRFVELRSLMDVPRSALEDLVQAAAEYVPPADESGV